MEYYDKDGFIQLIPVDHEDSPKPATVKKPKDHSIPFKKNSWKYVLFRKIRNWWGDRFVDSFHQTKRNNLLLFIKEKPKVYPFCKKLKKTELRKYAKDNGEGYILIDIGDGMYSKLSLSAYQKLSKIERMIITVELKACDDGYEDNPYTLYDKTERIDSINGLLSFINYYRKLVDGVGDVQAECCSFTFYKYKVRTLIMKSNGKIETYKGDFNEVMKEYGILPLI